MLEISGTDENLSLQGSELMRLQLVQLWVSSYKALFWGALFHSMPLQHSNPTAKPVIYQMLKEKTELPSSDCYSDTYRTHIWHSSDSHIWWLQNLEIVLHIMNSIMFSPKQSPHWDKHTSLHSLPCRWGLQMNYYMTDNITGYFSAPANDFQNPYRWAIIAQERQKTWLFRDGF